MNSKNTKSYDKTFRSKAPRNIEQFDKTDILILTELLRDSGVKSKEIAYKFKIPLSTIQRRRARIDKSTILKRDYVIDYRQFGLRRANILVDVSKGDCVDIAKRIVKEYAENVLEASITLGDPKVNLMVEVIYYNSDEIFSIIQHIQKMEHVEDVRWSEIIEAVVKNDSAIVKNVMSKFIVK